MINIISDVDKFILKPKVSYEALRHKPCSAFGIHNQKILRTKKINCILHQSEQTFIINIV